MAFVFYMVTAAELTYYILLLAFLQWHTAHGSAHVLPEQWLAPQISADIGIDIRWGITKDIAQVSVAGGPVETTFFRVWFGRMIEIETCSMGKDNLSEE